jgi:hypothetical protein
MKQNSNNDNEYDDNDDDDDILDIDVANDDYEDVLEIVANDEIIDVDGNESDSSNFEPIVITLDSSPPTTNEQEENDYFKPKTNYLQRRNFSKWLTFQIFNSIFSFYFFIQFAVMIQFLMAINRILN